MNTTTTDAATITEYLQGFHFKPWLAIVLNWSKCISVCVCGCVCLKKTRPYVRTKMLQEGVAKVPTNSCLYGCLLVRVVRM